MQYTQISLGSQDEDVKTAQELLNSTGRYNLVVDGIFGEQTNTAVKDYQRQNGLTVDGVIGPQTWASLTGGNQQSPEQETPKTDYETYTQKLEELYDAWTQRDPFSYDAQGDPLYQQYRELYTQQGRLAMEDTLGQAAALTGGYGSTYAQTAGQQTFQNYMQKLNAIVPELFDRAYDRYNDQGNRLMQQYQLTQSMADDAYAREGAAANIMAQIGDYTRLGELYGLSDEEIAKLTDLHNDSGGGTGYTGSNSSTESNGSCSKSMIIAMQRQLGVTPDGQWGPVTQAAAMRLWGTSNADKAWAANQEMLQSQYDAHMTERMMALENELNGYISGGASKSEINSWLISAAKEGYITEKEYEQLREQFLPRGYTY